MIVNQRQIFNLMDTNGRRKDVANALQGYLSILDNIQNVKKMEWASLPESFAQYEFYKQAIELSPEVLKKHGKYDSLQAEIMADSALRSAFEENDIKWIQSNAAKYSSFLEQFDMGVEDRARHYTSSLVKLGFTNEKRRISPVGELLLNPSALKRDRLERFLSIDNVNLIYLRQLLKLRIYDSKSERFYAPFPLAVFVLLRRKRISECEFFELVQALSPYDDYSDIGSYVDNYVEGDILTGACFDMPAELSSKSMLSEEAFRKLFHNGKSREAIEKYWRFYCLVWECAKSLCEESIDKLLSYYENNKPMLNKAFGRGKNLFSEKRAVRPDVSEFKERYDVMLSSELNQYLYSEFMLSKLLDQIREYSDTTKRIFKASGLIRFENGFVELALREICESIFVENKLLKMISGHVGKANEQFFNVSTLVEELGFSAAQLAAIEEKISESFPGSSPDEISLLISGLRRKEFEAFIEKSYPAERVKEILSLFKNRTNDNAIKREVCEDATVPTIYEYIVGIAWYYFSGKRIDLLKSYNLTLSADFEPLVHAGGGQGDIVIYEKDKVTMLEATLMNSNSQKRGEWEPVLRHSINLKVSEESHDTGRSVTTFFIADSFDYNTIHIWKAVSSVPLRSSSEKGGLTDNVVIMPVNTDELSLLMDKWTEYDSIINRVHGLFEKDRINFDPSWRESFMSSIM